MKYTVFDTSQVVNRFKGPIKFDFTQLFSTGNLIMIEKLVLGGTWTGDLPIFRPDALTSAAIKTR